MTDGLDLIMLAGIGGALVVYGLIKRASTRREDPTNPNFLLANIETPDPIARQEGNLALGIGLILLAGALFA